MFKLKNAARLIRIEPAQSGFDIHGKTIQNPKLQENHTVKQQVSHAKNWTSLKVDTNSDLNDGKADSNGALSSQNLTSNELRNASHISTINKGMNFKEQQPAEIREET